MFGSGPSSVVKVCCGPRCGSEPAHRAVYQAVESAAVAESQDTSVLPTMCRGWCGMGVTLVLPSGDTIKARDPDEARTKLKQNASPGG